MSTLKLVLKVKTIDNKVLLPAGTVLSTQILDALISSNKADSLQSYPILQYESVKEDLLRFLSSPPYNVIFPDKEQIAELMNYMEAVNLSVPILQSLYYFKEQDFYSYRHFLIVFVLSTLLAKDLISDYKDLLNLTATGPTHDIGKIYVPLYILKKTTPLNRSEKSILDDHTTAGYVLLSYYLRDAQALASKVARDHHERKDGSGYPRSISLRDLMVEIIAVSDVYDALISPRPYRQTSFDNRTALEEISGMAEKDKFGYDVIKVLLAHNRKSKPHYSEISISTKKRGTPPTDNLYGIITEEESDQKE